MLQRWLVTKEVVSVFCFGPKCLWRGGEGVNQSVKQKEFRHGGHIW